MTKGETKIGEALQSVDWDFERAPRPRRIHRLHPYPAKFIAEIPRELIRLFHPGDGSAVFDPFCGSGTTLVEAVTADLPAVGVDLNPIATLISRVKTTPLDEPLAPIAAELTEKAASTPAPIPVIPRLDHWFDPEIQDALARLTAQIVHVAPSATRDALQLSLSRIVVRVSNQDSDTRYAAIQKDVSAQQTYDGFIDGAREIDLGLGEAYGTLFASEPDCRVLEQDILDVKPADIGPVGLVVTSPPYPNAYEYWLYHKYRMYWLGHDPIPVREAEIGARPHYFGSNPQTEVDYQYQMGEVFRLLKQVLRPDGYACFLVGRSIIRGRTIDNRDILRAAAEPHGFEQLGEATRRISRTRKAFNPEHGSIDEEAVVVFGSSP